MPLAPESRCSAQYETNSPEPTVSSPISECTATSSDGPARESDRAPRSWTGSPLDAALAELRNRGVPVTLPVIETPGISRRLAFVRDPWGNMIELAERTPGALA